MSKTMSALSYMKMIIPVGIVIFIVIVLIKIFMAAFHSNKESVIIPSFIERSENLATLSSGPDLESNSTYNGFVEFFPQNSELIITEYTKLNKNDSFTLRYEGQLNKQLFDCTHAPSTPEKRIDSLFYISTDGKLVCSPVNQGKVDFNKSEILIEGVEAMRIRYGEDTDKDGLPNRYISFGPELAIDHVQNIKVSLLIKTRDKETGVLNTKYYTLQDVELGPFTDDIKRKVYSTSINIKPSIESQKAEAQ